MIIVFIDNIDNMIVTFHVTMCMCCVAVTSVFHYPPAYVPLTGERGSFSVLDLTPEEARLFYATHPQQRQVRAFGGEAVK